MDGTEPPAGDQDLSGGLDLGGGGADGAYRVLARKYRPRTFDDLIGQEPMVRTLTNAFESGRIAQAYMLTGVRGVGKTTTARILARALNYSVPGKIDRPTVAMPEPGEHCAAIMEGRHVDVIEMDAASHTGINDIRELTEASRYRPAVARYKVYIIDEVHMLSNQAFNGLLKTLEEPPEYVKFIFATTEIRKVPVTVLSRCQRFDLRRIDADRLVGLMRGIAAAEAIAVDDEALALIARAAEGSARDALSLLDQAAAHGAGSLAAEDVRQMLGLSDRARVIDLFAEIMRGDAAAALDNLADQYRSGVDPVVVLQDLAAFTHLVTKLKVAPSAGDDPAVTPQEQAQGTAFAAALTLRVLSRAWQMLLKGIEEAQAASRPLAAADMVLVRLAHAADLPTPDEALRLLRDGQGAASGPASAPGTSTPAASPSALSAAPPLARAPDRAPDRPAAAGGSAMALRREAPAAPPRPAAAPGLRLDSFEELVALAGTKRDVAMKIALERSVRLIRFEPGRIELSLAEDAPTGFVGDLGRRLQDWTGERWMITLGHGAARRTIHEERAAAKAQMVTDARADPLVAEVLARFPGAEIIDVRVSAAETAWPAGAEAASEAAPPPVEDESEESDDS